MKILVDRLTETPTPHEFEADPGWWDAACRRLSELGDARPEDFHMGVRAHRMGQDLFLEGEVRGAYALECSRCLSRYPARVAEPFRVLLEPAGERVPAEPESAAALARDGICLGDDVDTGLYRGREIELGSFFLEIVALALPVQPLCREDCKGLCPRCGADRNHDPCQCTEAPPPSPFAVLEALRRPADEGES